MSAEPTEDQISIELYVDALDHIARVARASRTQTRRLRWIEARAQGAVDGNEDWRGLDLPQSADSQARRTFKVLSRNAELEAALLKCLEMESSLPPATVEQAKAALNKGTA